MSTNFVDYTVPGVVDCSSCACKDAYICLNEDATAVLADNKDALTARITECIVVYKVQGTFTDVNSCGDKTATNVVLAETELTLRYDSEDFVDPTDSIVNADIACVSTDSCAVKAAIDLAEELPDFRIISVESTATTDVDGIYIATVSNGVSNTTFNIDLSVLLDDTIVTYDLDLGPGATEITLTGSDASTDTIDLAAIVVAAETSITKTNTDSIDITLSGTNDHNISAAVNIDPIGGNILTESVAGLYVAPTVVPGETSITKTNTDSADITLSGTANHNIQVDVNIDPAGTNQITESAAGLHVAAGAATSFSFTSNAGCGTAGVGSGKAVTAASEAAGVITLTPADEHTSERINGVGSVSFNLASLNDTVNFIVSETIINSTCRDMPVFVAPTATAQGTATAGDQFVLIQCNFDTGDGLLDSTSEVTHDIISDGEVRWVNFTNPRTAVIPANTTKTIRAQFILTKKRDGTGSFIGTGGQFSGSMRGIASTE